MQITTSTAASFLNIFILVDAFSGKISTPFLRSPSYIAHNDRTSSEIKALIYSWDETENGANNNNGVVYWEEREDNTLSDRGLGEATVMVEYLANENSISSLARLAVAFSPPERRINLKDIEQIEILLVDSDHIQLVAAVRHEEACVQLMVPVQFPNSCRDVSNMEECVLDNIDALDQDAGHRIQCQKIEDEMFDLYYDLDTSKATELPSWWTYPRDYELAQECETVKRLLNEVEFQNETKALAMRALNEVGGDISIMLERVVVTDVGPSGLNFCTCATTDVYNDNENYMLEVSYKFSSGNVKNANDLRAVVLGAITEAST